MKWADFWVSFLASLLANAIIYVPIFVAVLVIWRRYYPVLKIWGIPVFSVAGQQYLLVMSSRPDQKGRFRPGIREQEAMLDVKDFLQSSWLRLSSRIVMLKPQLSENASPDLLNDGNLVLFGSLRFNKWTVLHLARLANYDLNYTFKQINENWVIYDPVQNKDYCSNYVSGDTHSEGNHYDYSLFIRAPHTNGHSLIIFAGIHGAGTKAAVDAVLKPHLCQQISTMMRKQKVKAEYFVVLIKVKVHDFIRDDPIILDVKPIVAYPMLDAETHLLN
ncbi:MAG: hypothetical protein QOH63_924 [Acidobacteriota bacterium]|jgi:hypothetical protein|nr:hypothetical protein [Acidobacteriota bacterium]